jgi:hypothetical protein
MAAVVRDRADQLSQEVTEFPVAGLDSGKKEADKLNEGRFNGLGINVIIFSINFSKKKLSTFVALFTTVKDIKCDKIGRATFRAIFLQAHLQKLLPKRKCTNEPTTIYFRFCDFDATVGRRTSSFRNMAAIIGFWSESSALRWCFHLKSILGIGSSRIFTDKIESGCNHCL